MKARRTLLWSSGALLITLIAVPLALYAAAYGAAFPLGKALVLGPSFKGSTRQGSMAVEVSRYRIVCAATNGDYRRVFTFYPESLRQHGVTTAARGYRIQCWHDWLLIEDEGASGQSARIR